MKELKDVIAKNKLDMSPEEEKLLEAYLNPDLPCFLNARAAAQSVGLPSVEGLRIEAKFFKCLVAALDARECIFPLQKRLVSKSILNGLRPVTATSPAFQNPIIQDAHQERPCTFAPTDARKDDQDKIRFDLIPPGPLQDLAAIYTMGAKKYADRNWEKGLSWGRVFGAVMRHLWAFWKGEDNDPESGLPHLAHAAWGCFALLEYRQTHPEMDDRSRSGK